MRIGIFKPQNIRKNNAFFTGQHLVFKHLQDKYGHDVTYFIDDKETAFDDIKCLYLRENRLFSFVQKVKSKFLTPYSKYPYYFDQNLFDFDVIVTEGIHYPLIKYFQNYNGMLILNESITVDAVFVKKKVDYINQFFSQAIAVIVNKKIGKIYDLNAIKMTKMVIGHAIDFKTIVKKEKKFEFKFISSGRLVKEKGYEYIIRALGELKKDYPNIRLDILGDGPLRQNLQQVVIECNLIENVVFKGFIPYDTLKRELCLYDIYLSHPIETPQIAEAFHMGNIEAMASGVPVITTDCGGVPFVVEDHALIGRQKNISDIIENILLLIKNPVYYHKTANDGATYVKNKYSLDSISERWNELIIGNNGV
jgi:glycosyltransferase involved in cell wall biosynthesis